MKCQRVQYNIYIYIYVHPCINILKQKGMETTGVKSGVQSQEYVNIPVSLKEYAGIQRQLGHKAM